MHATIPYTIHIYPKPPNGSDKASLSSSHYNTVDQEHNRVNVDMPDQTQNIANMDKPIPGVADVDQIDQN